MFKTTFLIVPRPPPHASTNIARSGAATAPTARIRTLKRPEAARKPAATVRPMLFLLAQLVDF